MGVGTNVAVDVLGGCLVAISVTLGFAVARLKARARKGAARVVQLEEMAMTDGLTGLPNRRQWEEQLPRELARAIRYREPVCVAMLDLDHFKAYNDRYGHQAGDRLLKESASQWEQRMRDTDLLARYAGDEFALALPECEVEDAAELLERLRAATPEDESSSGGIAFWNGAEDAAALMQRADKALYEAKRSGRDRVVHA